MELKVNIANQPPKKISPLQKLDVDQQLLKQDRIAHEAY